ncbi:MAG: Spy/CpxP family protein refolding chaperone [Candidatus Omnitrophica bacterium]|nr:Spy/CpxP family protein refolding chaperone [Candidatus Omnitrophota bacterium]
MKKGVRLAAVLIAILFLASASQAFHPGKSEGHHKDFGEKFSLKAHLILKNEEELGLSDDQVEKVKTLKLKNKKGLIMQEAEIEVLSLELKSKMWSDEIDTSAINKLIDQKYELKKAKAKSSVEACVALKKILTKEQKAKLKALYKGCKQKEWKERD